MKILITITRLDEIGGAQVHIKDLAIELAKKGHEIYVVSGTECVFFDLFEKNKVKYIKIKNIKRNISMLYDVLSVIDLIKIIKEIKPDIVSCHSSKAGIITRLAAFFYRIPVVFTVHGWSFTDGVGTKKAKLYKLLEQLFSRVTTAFVNVSNYDKQLAIENKISGYHYVIHNCVHDKGFEIKKNREAVQITMIARFCNQKDHATLLTALNEIKDLNWSLNLVGAGDFQLYKQIIFNNGMSNKVHFLGQREDIDSILLDTDVFALCSNWEGFPISIVEAMSFSCPILASNVGGVREAVVNSYNGFLIKRGAVNDWVDKLTILIKHENIRRTMGLNSRCIFENKFHIGKMISNYESIFAEISVNHLNDRHKNCMKL